MPNKKYIRIIIQKLFPQKMILRDLNFKDGDPDVLHKKPPKFEGSTFNLERNSKDGNVSACDDAPRKIEPKVIVDIDIDLTKKIAATIFINGMTIFSKTKGD